LALLLLVLAIHNPATAGQIIKPAQPNPEIQQELGVSVPMRDGVRLAADVFRPNTSERLPALLVRTPYNRKSPAMASYRFFTRRGYAVVIEDARGRYASQGVFGEIAQEGADGNDTINWIAEQPWSNGRVGMIGSSYLGIVQWWAAIEDNPHLLAIAPVNSGDDDYLDRFYSPGGALKLGHRLLWLSENFTPPARVVPAFSSYIFHLPLRTADLPAIGMPSNIWRDALAHPSYDSFWKNLSIREKLGRVHIPVLSMSGWFDNYAQSELDAFRTLSRQNKDVETWIGPWAHDPGLRFRSEQFGPEANIHIRAKQADWFDRWLKNSSATEEQPSPEPRLHIFVMGANVWREESSWPLPHTRYTPLYLSSAGNANSASGDGQLHSRPLPKSPPDSFTYDPSDPVPTLGGAICCDPKILPPGPLDQTPVEDRPDVLVYTSAPLRRELEVTGPVRVVLYIATSANDTDFTAKLVDVQPDSRPLIVSDGLLRLRYRLSLDKPVFVKRDTAYQINVDAGVTSYVFLAGHRIRLEVSSSNFPRFDRNLNSMRPNADEFRILKARQTVYHNPAYPSALILPVIPHEANPDQPSPNQSISNQSISNQSRATAIAPATINSPPTPLPHVILSPRKATPARITNATLNLSMGATRDAGPSCRARK